MHIGIDIGYSSVKLIHGTESDPAAAIMPIGAAPRAQMKRGSDYGLDESAGQIVTIDGEEWVAGVETSLIQGFTPWMDSNYPRSAEYLALFRSALRRAGVREVQSLVIGLPVSQWKQEAERKALKGRLEGTHHIHDDLSVDVKKVEVLAAPAGALVHHLCVQRALPQDQRIEKDETVLIMDPGHFSMGWTIFKRGFDTASAGSTSNAGESIIRSTAQALSDQTGLNIRASRLEQAIALGQETVTAGLQEICFHDALEAQVQRTASANIRVISARVRHVEAERRIDVILVTGGWANLFAPTLASSFPQARIIITPDHLLANARGYHRAASRHG